ncbi:16S rRNA (cytosine(967)-C(5))-methyltransferase [Thiorhodovibrio winogradskyi]|nr:16S rRNA (cytosine(967)-C(5))-methyltransferase [Thiorhodovibrio winogradskyi]
MAHALAKAPAAGKPSRRRPRPTRGLGSGANAGSGPGAQVRATAAQVLTQVLERGRSLTAALAPYSSPLHTSPDSAAPAATNASPNNGSGSASDSTGDSFASPRNNSQDKAAGAQLTARDLPLLQELCFGVLRTLPRLDALIALLLQRPLKARDQDLRCLLRVGLYQLDALAMPDHAAVAATVGASAVLDKAWARGLLNATLRRFLRERDALCEHVAQDETATTLFPPWLLARLRRAWPDDWQQVVAASNTRAPMFLRVNPLRIEREAYRAQLTATGIAATAIADCPHGLQLHTPIPVSQLPGFRDGLVSVQDAGAQRAAPLLKLLPGQRVLDACAAPGNKTAHQQELSDNRLELLALDQDPSRVQSLTANLARLKLRADIRQADATAPRGDWAEQRYDRILLDAPCSVTGVIRRHPDIKWLRRDADIAALADTQTRLLEALWPLLAPQGVLLYVTCSLLPEENEQQIAAFLTRHDDAHEDPIAADWGLARSHGRQLLPREDGSDGFFFARLVKE